MSLRIVFMGTPDFSVPILEAIIAAGHNVIAVYSQPPRPAGRGMAEQPSPVHRCAEARGIPVFTPLNFKLDEARAAFTSHNADAAVVVAYGLILPEAVLKAPRFGCFNVHASKLPRWRGAAPIQRAIMAGDSETAVMVMQMEKGLDTGPVCATRIVPITDTLTAAELHDTLSNEGATLMVAALQALENGELIATRQTEEGVTYAAKIDKAKTPINFALPAEHVARHINGLSPFPGAWFETTHGGKRERIKVLRAIAVEIDKPAPPGTIVDDQLTIACASNAVRLLELQRAGKKPSTTEEFLRGFKITPGEQIV